MSKTKVRIAVSFATVSLIMVWLILSGFNENMRYYADIKDVNAMEASEYAKGLRVKGYLVAGTLVRTDKSLEVEFLIEDKGEQLKVRYTKELPDTFKDGAEVLVEGQFTTQGYFDANTLMAKCPSKYEANGSYSDNNTNAYSDKKGTN